jgi:hypothetical protein
MNFIGFPEKNVHSEHLRSNYSFNTIFLADKIKADVVKYFTAF